MEVETGIEPVCTALQAVASPLGHSTAGVDATAPRADDGIRTRDPHLGKVMRYQLRYIRAPRTTSSPVAKDDDSPPKCSRTNPMIAAVNGIKTVGMLAGYREPTAGAEIAPCDRPLSVGAPQHSDA
jgi:hypothetical protein